MSQAIDQAEDLRKRAIDILLTERAAIDERLATLSYDMASAPTTSVASSLCLKPFPNEHVSA
jgi:hypothetical protein